MDPTIIEEAWQSAKWCWINGITTNPTLLAQSNYPAEETMKKIKKQIKRSIFYQLVGQALKSTDAHVAAVSLKNPEEVVEARIASVSIIPTRFTMLAQMMHYDLSEATLDEFNEPGFGIQNH